MKINFNNIIKMENIMVDQENQVKELEKLLKDVNLKISDYKKLFDYYYSDKRNKDLECDEKNLIPDEINRGVLSEDGLYNLFLDTHDVAILMIETALKMLKIN